MSFGRRVAVEWEVIEYFTFPFRVEEIEAFMAA